jgi:hypothetical protein
MQELLAHPVVQGGVAPFVTSLAAAAALSRTRWLSIAQVVGFAVCVTLVTGWSIEPLTSTRKLAIVGVGTVVLCIAYEWARARARDASVVAVAALAIASSWMLWRLLEQRDVPAALGAGAVAAGYVALLAGSTLKVSKDPVRGAAAGAMLGLGTGLLALLGASAVLGLAGLGVGFAALATLVVQGVRNRAASTGRSISLPAAAVAALTGAAAVMTGELPWYSLLPMVLIAPAAHLSNSQSVRRRSAVACLAGAAPVAIAILLAWFRPA